MLRTTSQSRIQNSQISWAAGFFGSSFEVVPDPLFTDVMSDFDVVVIPEGGTENNTLASCEFEVFWFSKCMLRSVFG